MRRVENNDFEHAARQYYIRCAKDALSLAPLPEFKEALYFLEEYDREPTKLNRKRLMKAYRSLRKGERDSRRDYGYTAVGCFHDGLTHVLARTLLAPEEVSSSSCVYFSEAFYCAGRSLDISTADDWVEENARKAASDRYWAIYTELFPEVMEGAKEVAVGQ